VAFEKRLRVETPEVAEEQIATVGDATASPKETQGSVHEGAQPPA